MSDQVSPPPSGNFQRYHVLSSDDDDFEDGGNVVLASPSSELGGLVTNASMHSTGGGMGGGDEDRLPSRSPTKSFEEIRSVATSASAQSSIGSVGGRGSRHIGLQPSHGSGGGGGLKSRGNSSSLPNSPLHSLTRSASRDESDEEGEGEEEDDDGGEGAGADEGRLDGGGGKLTWDDDDDLSDGDDEAGLRRYNHFARAGAMPAEFESGRHLNESTWKRMTSYLLELRMAARQRRAHRLLSMSGTHMDSPAQQCRLCFMTYCWDATDRSILLLIVAVFAWMVLGFVLRPGKKWWYWGLAVLFVRLAARPLVEALGSSLRRGRPSRSSSSASAAGFGRITSPTVASADALEMGSSSHHRSLGRQAQSRSPTPKTTMV